MFAHSLHPTKPRTAKQARVSHTRGTIFNEVLTQKYGSNVQRETENRAKQPWHGQAALLLGKAWVHGTLPSFISGEAGGREGEAPQSHRIMGSWGGLGFLDSQGLSLRALRPEHHRSCAHVGQMGGGTAGAMTGLARLGGGGGGRGATNRMPPGLGGPEASRTTQEPLTEQALCCPLGSWFSPHGGRLQLVLMRTPPPRYLSKLGAGGGGSWGGGVGGRVGGGGGLAAWPGGGGLRATHYYHMHTSWGCLGAWGYRGMHAIVVISCLCQEESLKGLKD